MISKKSNLDGKGDPLGAIVKGHYDGLSLSESKIERLKQKIYDEAVSGHMLKYLPRFSFSSSYTRAFALAVAAVMMFGLIFFQKATDTNFVYEIASEVAKNHLKNLPLEFTTENYDVLSQKMARLNFKLISPLRSPKELKLIGGRYCSIQGNTAAQLYVESEDGTIGTLYQFQLPDVILQESAAQIGVVRTQIWEENGIVMGLAFTEELDAP